MKLARFLFFFWSSLPFSLVVKDNEEMIDRRFKELRRSFPSSASSFPLVDSFSLSSSLEEEEPEDFGIDGQGKMTPTDPLGIRDEREVVSES